MGILRALKSEVGGSILCTKVVQRLETSSEALRGGSPASTPRRLSPASSAGAWELLPN